MTRTRIVEAARDLLTESGILEVSVADISARAGTNVALVSYHFGGREALMVALARADAEEALRGLQRLTEADMTPPEKIAAHIAGMIRTYAKRPYLNRLLQKLLREGSPAASAEVASFFLRPVVDARRMIIEDGIASGYFAPIDPGLVSFALEGACAQLFSSAQARQTVLRTSGLSVALLESYIKTVTALVIGGLTAGFE